MKFLPPYCGWKHGASLNPKYQLISADPPWSYSAWTDKAHKTATKHYPVMTTDDLCKLQIQNIVADNAILLMWSTWPTLADAMQVGSAWGFEYKTLGFIWLKRTSTGSHWHTGLGHYTRANTEPCLLFRKGAGIPRIDMGTHQILDQTGQLSLFEEPLIARIGRHSQKPQIYFDRVDALFGDVRRIELFARYSRKGWDSIGNEIDGRDICEVLSA